MKEVSQIIALALALVTLWWMSKPPKKGGGKHNSRGETLGVGGAA